MLLDETQLNWPPPRVSREQAEPLDLLDPLAKMAQGEVAVRPVLLVALARLVLLDSQDPQERKDLPVLMDPL